MMDRSTLKAALQGKPGCLSVQELERLAENPLEKHPHVAACPRCQAEIAMLREFEESSPLPDEGAAVSWIAAQMERNLDQIKNPATARKKAGEGAMGWIATLFGTGNARWIMPVAALAVVAVASAILLRPRQPELQAQLGNAPAVFRSQEVEVLAPVGQLAEPPKQLQWKDFAGAVKYNVAVMEVDHAVLWSETTNYTTVTIPGATRAKMLPGKPVLWQVTALDSQGRSLAVSQLQRFSVARKSPAQNSGTYPQS